MKRENYILQETKQAAEQQGSGWGFVSARIVNFLVGVCELYKKSIYIAYRIHIESLYVPYRKHIESLYKAYSSPIASIRLYINYWIPAFAGMTDEYRVVPFNVHVPAYAGMTERARSPPRREG